MVDSSQLPNGKFFTSFDSTTRKASKSIAASQFPATHPLLNPRVSSGSQPPNSGQLGPVRRLNERMLAHYNNVPRSPSTTDPGKSTPDVSGPPPLFGFGALLRTFVHPPVQSICARIALPPVAIHFPTELHPTPVRHNSPFFTSGHSVRQVQP